jgi:hypothetical protein
LHIVEIAMTFFTISLEEVWDNNPSHYVPRWFIQRTCRK